MANPLIPVSTRQVLFFAAALVLYQFLTYVANDMIMPGMLAVVESFHANESAVATSLTAYILGGASLQWLLGPLSDAYGRRPVMLVGVVIFIIFTLGIIISTSIHQFLWARFFEGLGLCFTNVVGYSALQEILPEMEAVRLVGLLSNISSLAPLIGPLAGAVFISYFHWRGIFVLIMAFSALALWGIWRNMPEPVGAVKTDGKIIPRVPFTLKNVLGNYRDLLSNRGFMFGTLVVGLLSLPCIAWIAVSPLIIVSQAHLSIYTYALWQLPMFIALMLGNVYLRYLTRHYDLSRILFTGAGITLLGMLLAAVLPFVFDARFHWLMPGLVIYGFGMGVTYSPLTRRLLFATEVSKGTAYAMISMISMITQAIGVELVNYVYQSHNNLHFALYCAATGLFFALALALTLQHTDAPIEEEGAPA